MRFVAWDRFVLIDDELIRFIAGNMVHHRRATETTYATLPRLLRHSFAERVGAILISRGHPDYCVDLNRSGRSVATRRLPTGCRMRGCGRRRRGEALDGRVRVTVSAGRISEVTLDPRAMRTPSEDLAAAFRDAANAAIDAQNAPSTSRARESATPSPRSSASPKNTAAGTPAIEPPSGNATSSTPR
jgi:hypothetical protein